MENKQEIFRWFAEILFKLKLVEAEVNVMDVSDMTEYGVAELKSIADNFIRTGQSIKDEMNKRIAGAL